MNNSSVLLLLTLVALTVNETVDEKVDEWDVGVKGERFGQGRDVDWCGEMFYESTGGWLRGAVGASITAVPSAAIGADMKEFAWVATVAV